jgi:putative ABC transport system ATP-binding protein
MALPGSAQLACWSASPDATRPASGSATGHFWPDRGCNPATPDDHPAATIETVISRRALGILRRPEGALKEVSHPLGIATGNLIVLSVRNLTKTYRSAGEQVVVLRGVNLDIAAGERVALTGESGSGKSTLLHLIAGLDAADGGEIILADTSLADLSDAGRAELRRDRLGLVFQQFNLIPSLSVEDNLVFQSRIAGRHDAAWHGELVERLGLGALLKRYPEQLSGGQQQRVAIGRALATKPLLLLADEPTGNLDEATADDVLALTRDLVTRTGCGFLMVTHSERLAATLDRRVHLHAGLIA